MYKQANTDIAFMSRRSPIRYLAGKSALIEGAIRPYYRKDIYPCTNLDLFRRAGLRDADQPCEDCQRGPRVVDL